MNRVFVSSLFAVAISQALVSKALVANDTAAMGTAANIQFVKNDKVVIHREDLEIGPLKALNVPIHVRYVMENLGSKPEEIQVAFPLPDCSFYEYVNARVYERVSRSETCVKEPQMRLFVEGKQTEGSWVTKLSINGVRFDQTEESKKAKLDSAQLLRIFEIMPEMPTKESEQQEKAFENKLSDICRNFGGKLAAHGCDAFRKIRAQRVFLWRHSFLPRKRTIVIHDYVVESSYREYAEESFKKDVFCLKDKSVSKAWDMAKDDSLQADSTQYFSSRQKFIGYVLKTGANWAAPIGEFNFTLKKSNAEQFVSTCFDGLEKAGPLEFRAKRKNFIPKEDLYVLFFNLGPQ